MDPPLGGQYDVITLAEFFDPTAYKFFGFSLSLGARHDRVELGSVDEINPAFQRVIDLPMRLGLGILLAESHRAETDSRHF